MTITLGEKTIKDLTQQELVDFLYNQGYSCAKEYWHQPEIILYDFDGKETVFFEFTQKSKLHEDVKYFRGHIRFSGKDITYTYESPVVYLDGPMGHRSYPFTMRVFNYWITRGYAFDFDNYLVAEPTLKENTLYDYDMCSSGGDFIIKFPAYNDEEAIETANKMFGLGWKWKLKSRNIKVL